MYVLAQEILGAGASLILESTFIHPDTPGELQALLEATVARLSVVYCCARGDRHPGHLDTAALTPAQCVALGWLDSHVYPGRVIPVDTTDFDALDVAEIVRRLQEL
jgi:hypothetical protein